MTARTSSTRQKKAKCQHRIVTFRIIALFSATVVCVLCITPASGFLVVQDPLWRQVRVIATSPPTTKNRHDHDRCRWDDASTTSTSVGVVRRGRQSFGDTLIDSALPVVLTTINTLRRELMALSAVQMGLLVAAVAVGFSAGRATPFWRRYTDPADIPSSCFVRRRTLRGRAVRVSDGDTIRFLHRPMFWSPRRLDRAMAEKSSEVALPVRFCSVDTPETAKFGASGQPFAAEAKEYVTTLLDSNRNVYVRLLKRDQYNRIVGQVYVRKWGVFKTYLDEELLRRGLAEVYTGAGAVYGRKGKEAYQQMEQLARSQKVGMWSLGRKLESAADYKKRTKQ